jgi:hypothetical protein
VERSEAVLEARRLAHAFRNEILDGRLTEGCQHTTAKAATKSFRADEADIL